MGNSLLDFVLALARDPDAAARYAADPAGALAAAGLPDVTIADVANVMPVVADSLAMATPAFGNVGVDAAAAVNVWTSGAAAAAFDAFDAPLPQPIIPPVSTPSVDTSSVDTAPYPPDQPVPAGPDGVGEPPHQAVDPATMDWPDGAREQAAWDQHPWDATTDHQVPGHPDHSAADHQGFDLL